MDKRYLTGRFFHRRTWLGWLVLMVEEREEYMSDGRKRETSYWRRAEDEDLMELNLKRGKK